MKYTIIECKISIDRKKIFDFFYSYAFFAYATIQNERIKKSVDDNNEISPIKTLLKTTKNTVHSLLFLCSMVGLIRIIICGLKRLKRPSGLGGLLSNYIRVGWFNDWFL